MLLSLPCIVLHCTILHCTTLHCTILHYTALYYNILYYATLHCTILHCTTLHCAALHYTVLYCTTLHCTTLYYTTLHYTILHYTTLHYTTLHYTTLHYTAPRNNAHRNTFSRALYLPPAPLSWQSVRDNVHRSFHGRADTPHYDHLSRVLLLSEEGLLWGEERKFPPVPGSISTPFPGPLSGYPDGLSSGMEKASSIISSTHCTSLSCILSSACWHRITHTATASILTETWWIGVA